jgi:hypothetical protein
MRVSILSFSLIAATISPLCAGATVTVAFVDLAHYHDAAFQRDYQTDDEVL